jgi:uncharacterized membrane protein YheB (UPF0754 family)
MEPNHKLLIIALIPLISASIGWFTNFIAIKMLFYPRKKRNLVFIQLHGVFPKRQKEMATKLGDLFARELGVQDTINLKLKDIFSGESLKTRITEKVQSLAHEFISRELPFLAAMVPGELIDRLSGEVATTLESNLRDEIKSGAAELSDKLDVKKLVEHQIESLDVEELEIMLQSLLKKEFRFIELSGAVLGFLIGCAQVAITYYFFTPAIS